MKATYTFRQLKGLAMEYRLENYAAMPRWLLAELGRLRRLQGAK